MKNSIMYENFQFMCAIILVLHVKMREIMDSTWEEANFSSFFINLPKKLITVKLSWYMQNYFLLTDSMYYTLL